MTLVGLTRQAPFLAIMTVLIGTTACTVSEPDAVRPEVAIHVNPCDVVEREEVERAVGLPLPIERLQLFNSEARADQYYCEWLDGDDLTGEFRVRSLFHIGPERAKPEEFADLAAKNTRVEGLGELAWWAEDVAYGELQVITLDGAKVFMSVDLPEGSMPTEEHRARHVELVREALPRLEAKLPGQASAMPKLPEPPIDPCDIVPAAARERILGWGVGAHAEATNLGGDFGGYWRCGGSSSGRTFSFGLSINPATASDLAKVGPPIDGIGRPAHLRSESRRSDDGSVRSDAAIAFTAHGGRLVVLKLRDAALDDAGQRQKLAELARSAIENGTP